MNTYPSAPISVGAAGGSIQVYSDEACTLPVEVFDLNGDPTAGAPVSVDGVVGEFQCEAFAPLYVRAATGDAVALYAAAESSTAAPPVSPILVQSSENTGTAVELRDDFDGIYGPGWLGVLPTPEGDSDPDFPAGVAIHPAGYVSGAFPQGPLGNWISLLATGGWFIRDTSEESDAQVALELLGPSTGKYWPQLQLVADTGTPDDQPALLIQIQTGEDEAVTLWRLEWDGSEYMFADETYTSGDIGPVITDQSDGHTYRIISTDGVLSTVQVT